MDEVLVSPEDQHILNSHNWLIDQKGYVYANLPRLNGKRQRIFLHRVIINPEPGQPCDHINRDKLDNRRENLRVCTYAENNQNRRSTNKTGLPKGVYPCLKKYKAAIQIYGKQKHLGVFKTPQEAHKAYLEAGGIA